jgi:hypothetical protein
MDSGKVKSGGSGVSERLLAGRIRVPDVKEAPPAKRKLQGRITSAKPVEAKAADVRDAPEPVPVPIESGDMISGVVAASVALNSLRPLQVRPAIWDVFSAPFAILDESFEGFRLPDPSFSINDYISGGAGVEYDAACLLGAGSPTRQRLPDGGAMNSYYLHARAIFELSAEATINLDSLLDVAGVSYQGTLWTGPFQAGEREFPVSISDHYVPGVGYLEHHRSGSTSEDPVFTLSQQDPALLEHRSGLSHAHIDLHFLSPGDGAWSLTVVRSR